MRMKEGFPGTASPAESPREKEHRAIARRIAGEGIVLLENDGILPLKTDAKVALYGAGARHTILGGTGSGSVNCRPGVSVCEGLQNAGITIVNLPWLDALDRAYEDARKAWMDSIYAMSVPGDFDSLYTAHASHPLQAPAGDPIQREGDTETAIYVISRVSGEGADRHPVPGDYILSENEERQLREVCGAYPRVIVVLNVGGVMDLSFMDQYRNISALVLMSQAGMEGGNALADILTGKVNPSGRLSETWAKAYEDYPCADTFSHMNGNLIEEKYREGIYVGYRWFDAFELQPRYPFGYGLSYTSFEKKTEEVTLQDTVLQARFSVTNTGKVPGKEVIFLFSACPAGLRRKERKRLLAYGKTGLLAPGETEVLTLHADLSLLASYHGGKSCWFLDEGAYALMLADDAAHWTPVAALTLGKTLLGGKQHRICPLKDALPELTPDPAAEDRWEKQLREALAGLPEISMDEAAEKALAAYSQPATKEAVSDPLVERMTLEEKARLCCGAPKGEDISFIGDSGRHVPGSAAETTSVLEKDGIPATVLADGPAGLRLTREVEINPETGRVYPMSRYESLENRIFGKEFPHEGAEVRYQFCTAIPVGMLLAQTFDPAAVAEIGGVIAREMEEMGVTWWLAPGMNIKRNPLCGRNFEYYSEDPLHAGRIAAALTRGVQAHPGAAVTIKHFACNNQEDNRRGVSSIVSERALREIYLRGFEIAIREAQPWAIMTSYNKVNGEHTANSRDLCTLAAREEWGFRGIIMTDWTTTNFEGGSSAAGCVSAGNDLVMPGLVSDIQEIMDAVREENDQSLSLEALDLSCARLLTAIRKLCAK